jgi:hypothetical protein
MVDPAIIARLILRLDVTGSLLGFVGAILLLVSAVRVHPFQAIVDRAASAGSGEGGQFAAASATGASRVIAKMRNTEHVLLIVGAIFLSLGFGCSVLKDFPETTYSILP